MTLLFTIFAVGAVGVALAFALRSLWVRNRPKTRPWDAMFAQPWLDALERVRTNRDLGIVEVVENYQMASTGTKSYVRWIATGYVQDTWFKGCGPFPVGQFLVVRPNSGWGPHNRNPQVLWVDASKISGRASRHSRAAAERLHPGPGQSSVGRN